MTTTDDLANSLEITKTERRENFGGTWIHGTIAGHRLEVLVFEDHAENEMDELGQSRISKLWLRCQADRQVVANFDRGWDLEPANDTAWAIVDFLADGIAEYTFGH